MLRKQSVLVLTCSLHNRFNECFIYSWKLQSVFAHLLMDEQGYRMQKEILVNASSASFYSYLQTLLALTAIFKKDQFFFLFEYLRL